MNKRILPVFVFCALCYSAQAQDAKGGISDAMMQQIKQSYQNTSADQSYPQRYRQQRHPQTGSQSG